MFESWTTSEKLAAALAAGLGLVLFARRRDDAPFVGLDPGLPEEHRRVIQAALARESDPAVLHSLASKLGAAGHRRSAEATAKRADEVRGAFFASGGAGADAHVLRAQICLRALGWEIRADGLLGSDTRRAISEFQSLHDLDIDGFPGPATLHALETASGAVT